jgi:hypothetical protein
VGKQVLHGLWVPFPGSDAEEDDAELVLGKGSREEELLALMDGSAESKPEQ